ncbi:MAG: cell division ATP-binding protein FtsE [Oscillospiraceae bacterium]|nr:cell division ATP-binding protein FtsE [Oscillospiraceae bacterium]
MIELKNVSLVYNNDVAALKNVSLKIDSGEFVFVVGTSGAGKSSLLKIITRELTPDEGTVIVNGFDLSKIKERQMPLFRRSIGMIFQDFRLIQNMSVFDNVAFGLRVTGHSNRYLRNRVPYALDLVELAQKAKSYPKELSGGEQQRVAIARALACDPPLIIADEPTGNIDPVLSAQIVKLLRNINRYCGTTILLVTHEHEIVRSFNCRTISINDGVVEFDKVWG